MEARLQATPTVQPLTRQRVVNIIAVMWVALHAVWFSGPLIAPDHDLPSFTYFVTASSLAIGLTGIVGLRANRRWGWWTLVVITIFNVLLTLPEVFGLPGVLRVISIAAMLILIATLVLLFRPGVRPVQG